MKFSKLTIVGIATALLPAAAAPSAWAAPSYVRGGAAICRSATAQLNREVRLGGSDPSPSQIMRSFSEEARTLLWESRAFGELPVPASWHRPVRQIMTLYRDAGEELRFLVREEGYGEQVQAQIDLNDSDRAVNDAGRVVGALGIRGCGAE